MQPDILKIRLLKIFHVLIIGVGIYFGIKYLFGLLLPFIIAVAIAELTKKPIDSLTARTRLPRKIVSASVVTLAMLAFLGLLWCAVYGIYSAAQAGLEHLPELLPLLEKISASLRDLVNSLHSNLPASLATQITEAPAAIIQSAIKGLTTLLTDFAGRVPTSLITVAVSVVASYIIAADYHKLCDFLGKILKSQTVDKLIKIRSVIYSKFRLLIKGYGILLSVTFGELLIGFWILDIKNAAMLAAIIAICDILPVLGTGTFLIPWAVVMLIQGNVPLAVGLAVLYAVITIIRNVIEPHIIGAQIKLSPLIVLICIFVGYKVFGLLGLLLAPFAASIIKELVKQDVL